ncbi:MAG: GAF domain-containing protein [Bacteroidota bacterium]|nr:GAF domain-containing protein [Bacteroidota bacterium]
MAENIIITASTKEDQYKQLIPQIKALVEGEEDVVANMANVCAALKYGLDFFWVGFYLVKNNQLVLGPFQGPIACTRINKGKGVCGTAWQKAETIIVPDVEKFEGHIACSSLTKSEIVIPMFNHKNDVIGVLDVDSDELNSFDATDDYYLKEILNLLFFN